MENTEYFGDNARVRQLIDGSWVAEIETGWWIFRSWKYISYSGITWDYFVHGIHICCTKEVAKTYLARTGLY